MSHPLIAVSSNALRSRVLAFIKNGILFPGRSDIIFVCGGNNADQMRPQFLSFCNSVNTRFLLFQPEYAIEQALSFDDQPFNLSDFEELVGHLALAIVIFPEAAGSYGEAGYFSAKDELAQKTILVLDENRLNTDSFISIGPAKLINDKTRFHPSIQIDYKKPKFNIITDRINQREGTKRKKPFPTTSFKETSLFEKFVIVAIVFDILNISSISDVIYVVKGLFGGKINERQVKHIASILYGAKLIEQFGEIGEYKPAAISKIGYVTKDGYNSEFNSLRIEISMLLLANKNNIGSAINAD